MAARVPSVLNAAIELGFIAGAAVLGALAAPLWALPVLAIAMILYWSFNRRAGLAQLKEIGLGRLTSAIAVSVALIAAILGASYWIGNLLSGLMT